MKRAPLRQRNKTGQRVEVASARTDLTQVFANPIGGFTMESAVAPQRAQQADGSWADIDLTLHRGGDNRWRPNVSVVDVRFSDGGEGPFVTLVRAGKSMTLTWPNRLPAPTVEAETATYAEVLPDVDLVVKATRTGFTHVLVVKAPQAAANPAVREIRLVTGGDAELMCLPNGELRAVAEGRVLAFAPAPTMWDSSTPSPEGGAASAMGSPTEVDEPA